jgi:site-specific DNA recombinase
VNQKRILEAYCRDHGIVNYMFFVDDGWSGANFDRPNFQAMLARIENGEIKTVITKDLSRLGRNYLQVGMYTEVLFPQKGVRYIAINDGVDSMQGDNDLTPLKNLFNEWMVRDTSKKIKAVFRSKGMSGKPITSQPVYGYLKDENGGFVIDEEAAPVVRQIYSLCLAGNGPTQIARKLTEQNIPTPGTLEYRRTGSTRRYYPDYPCKWATNTVVHILERREYLGHTVNFKTEKISYKVKSSAMNPEEKQMVFENTHEPIIERDVWERVQELRKQRKRPNRYGEVGLFSGMLFCADCGSVLYQQRYQTDTRKQDCYICGSYKKRTTDCTSHFIRTDHLAAGLCYFMGGTVKQSLDAASCALQNILGTICDPVAGLVQVPCISRNAMSTANALVCANIVINGFDPCIPLDESAETMFRVGKQLPPELRCTCMGGLCTTPTGIRLAKEQDERNNNCK